MTVHEYRHDYQEAAEVWRNLDILDHYHAAALSHPVDKKNKSEVESALRKIQNTINIKLYGARKGDSGKSFWDAMKDPGKRKQLLGV